MSEEAIGASNAPSSEAVSAPVEQVSTPAASPSIEPDKPSGSTREALERAIASVGPTEGQTEAKAQRQRTPDGKFAPEVKPVEAQPKPGEQAKAVQQPVQVPGQAPQRFTKAAQEAWALTPEPVKADVERAITEMTQGIEKYRQDAEAYQPFREFASLAKQNNIAPDVAIKNYIEADQMLMRDPFNGLLNVMQKTNINPVAAAQAILRHFGAPVGQDGQVAQLPPEMTQLQQINAQLMNEIAQLKNSFGSFTQNYQQQQYQQHYQATEQSVMQFASDKPHFAEVAPTVEKLIASGFAKTLPEAYEAALRLTPEVAVRIEQAKTVQHDPAQTQVKASKSITGTPSSGSNPALRKAPGSPREALSNAFASVGI